ADVGDPVQVGRMADRAAAELGAISILVNNAGTVYRATLESFDISGMERMRRTNVDGVIHSTRAVIAGMKKLGHGRVVNVSSIAGHGTRLSGLGFYGATKAAVSLLTRKFAQELGPHGITVNAVAPGVIVTDMVKEGLTEVQFREAIAQVAGRSMVGRV